MPIPPYKKLHPYVLKALKELGGEAPVKDVERVVADMLNLTPEERQEIHKDKLTKLSYRVAWSRFYLKKKGLLESAKRGVSVLSEKGKEISNQ
jgi:restriction endonuclease Mrr